MPPPDELRALFALLERRLSACRLEDLLTFIPARDPLSGPDLLREIGHLAHRLEGARIGKGLRVLVAVSDPFTLLLSVPALWSVGCVPVLIEPSPTREELLGRIAQFGPDRILADASAPLPFSRDLESPRLPLLRIARPRVRRRVEFPRTAVLARTTSGSTGPGRGVALSGRQILADARNILATLRITPRLRSLAAVPLAHAYGFSTLVSPLLFHAQPAVLLERPLPEQFRDALGRSRSLFFPAVPPLIDLLCRAGIPRSLLGRIRVCISAGAPLEEEAALGFLRSAGTPVRNFYGASECGAISCQGPRSVGASSGSAGRALSGVGISIVPVRGLPAGTRSGEPGAGRVVVTGPAVAFGTVGGSERNRIFRGRFSTEDFGRIDSNGELRLLGRLDRVINVGSLKVRPEEVEEVLRSAPGVVEAVVLPLPDPRRGEAVAAIVAARPGARREDLLEVCRKRLSPHKVPRSLRILPALPRTSRGKIDLAALRALLAPESTRSSARMGGLERDRLTSASPGRDADKRPPRPPRFERERRRREGKTP